MYSFKCFTRKVKRSKINDLKLDKRGQIRKGIEIRDSKKEKTEKQRKIDETKSWLSE